MAPANKPAARKRNRKRKRRAASSSSDSDSSNSDSSSDGGQKTTVVKRVAVTTKNPPTPSASSSSSSASSSDEDSDEEKMVETTANAPTHTGAAVTAVTTRPRSLSPTPPSATIPSFVPTVDASEDAVRSEQQLKERFRSFWMTSLADAFKDDLEQIRKVRRPFFFTQRRCSCFQTMIGAATDGTTPYHARRLARGGRGRVFVVRPAWTQRQLQ